MRNTRKYPQVLAGGVRPDSAHDLSRVHHHPSLVFAGGEVHARLWQAACVPLIASFKKILRRRQAFTGNADAGDTVVVPQVRRQFPLQREVLLQMGMMAALFELVAPDASAAAGRGFNRRI